MKMWIPLSAHSIVDSVVMSVKSYLTAMWDPGLVYLSTMSIYGCLKAMSHCLQYTTLFHEEQYIALVM